MPEGNDFRSTPDTALHGKITAKGQTTIPLAIRERLGVKPGDRVDDVVGDDRQIMLRKAQGQESLRVSRSPGAG